MRSNRPHLPNKTNTNDIEPTFLTTSVACAGLNLIDSRWLGCVRILLGGVAVACS
jgi:hypothetical protein